MLQKKICMIGSFAVGKTSLVRRIVSGIFSEKYLTTVGVRIEKLRLRINSHDLLAILWDLHGEDEFQKLRISYLRGAAGYLLVADGTRSATLEQAVELNRTVERSIGPLPFVLAVNKCDLEAEWEVGEPSLEALRERGWMILRTSAKDETGVVEAFGLLGQRILESHDEEVTG